MQPIKFYNELPEMEFNAGDTLPAFSVTVSEESLSGASMNLVLLLRSNPVEAALTKACTLSGSTFSVQLTSSDTSGLNEGEYIMEFIMTLSGNSYKKLRGNVYIHGSTGGYYA